MYKEIVIRFFKLLNKFGFFKAVHKITYKGKGVSLNQFYSQGHWSTRHKIKNDFRKIFDKLFEQYGKLEWMDNFTIVTFYNSRHDPDNVVGMNKLFIDSIKKIVDKEGNVIRDGYIKDDSKKYCKGVFIIPDESLENNTFEFLLISH